MRMGVVCGSFHKDEVSRMLGFAVDDVDGGRHF